MFILPNISNSIKILIYIMYVVYWIIPTSAICNL
jgi:hypothetical protein